MKYKRVKRGTLLFSSSSLSYSTGKLRASTNCRHRTGLYASALTSVQVFPARFASSTTVRFRVVFGRLRFLVPCGFQSSAVFATSPTGLLTVWPIQFHFRSLIICSKLVLFHSSSLLMTSGQRIFSMGLNHLLTKTCF